MTQHQQTPATLAQLAKHPAVKAYRAALATAGGTGAAPSLVRMKRTLIRLFQRYTGERRRRLNRLRHERKGRDIVRLMAKLERLILHDLDTLPPGADRRAANDQLWQLQTMRAMRL